MRTDRGAPSRVEETLLQKITPSIHIFFNLNRNGRQVQCHRYKAVLPSNDRGPERLKPHSLVHDLAPLEPGNQNVGIVFRDGVLMDAAGQTRKDNSKTMVRIDGEDPRFEEWSPKFCEDAWVFNCGRGGKVRPVMNRHGATNTSSINSDEVNVPVIEFVNERVGAGIFVTRNLHDKRPIEEPVHLRPLTSRISGLELITPFHVFEQCFHLNPIPEFPVDVETSLPLQSPPKVQDSLVEHRLRETLEISKVQSLIVAGAFYLAPILRSFRSFHRHHGVKPVF